MSSTPATWNSLPIELKLKIYDMILEIQPGPKTPDKLTVFCIKNPTPKSQLCLESYHETNRVMTPKTLKEWKNIPHGLLSKVRHLYLLFERDTNIEDIAKLAENPLGQTNNLHSITIDISRISRPILDWSGREFRWEPEAIKIIVPLMQASKGCVERVTLVTRRNNKCDIGDLESCLTWAIYCSPEYRYVVENLPLEVTVWVLDHRRFANFVRQQELVDICGNGRVLTPEEEKAICEERLRMWQD